MGAFKGLKRLFNRLRADWSRIMKKWYSVRKKLKSNREILVDNFESITKAKDCCDRHIGSYVLELTEERVYTNPE